MTSHLTNDLYWTNTQGWVYSSHKVCNRSDITWHKRLAWYYRGRCKYSCLIWLTKTLFQTRYGRFWSLGWTVRSLNRKSKQGCTCLCSYQWRQDKCCPSLFSSLDWSLIFPSSNRYYPGEILTKLLSYQNLLSDRRRLAVFVCVSGVPSLTFNRKHSEKWPRRKKSSEFWIVFFPTFIIQFLLASGTLGRNTF